MADLELRKITKRFTTKNAEHLAVDSLDLSFGKGEFVSLVGPSGCGKTTVLRMIAGLEDVDSGAIVVDGKDVSSVPPQQRGMSMVFQNYAIFPHMTVEENIGYGLKIAKVPPVERREQVERAAKLVQVDQLLHRRPRQLSGGQRQRVAVARALVRSPEIMLLDEPLSNLDAKLRDETRAQLKELHQTMRNTMIYVTHDQLEALTLSDRIAVMKDGRIQQFASPSEVFHAPVNEFVASFIGSPTMNFLDMDLSVTGAQAVLRADFGMRLTLDADGWVSPPADAPVRVGIRPDGVRLSTEPTEASSPATVRLVEPIGSEAIVHTSIGTHGIVAKVNEDQVASAGDTVHVHFPLEHLHVFDAGSGVAIRHAATRSRRGARPAPAS